MREINFSHNWNNKLNNELFTTIRKYIPYKEKYYRKNIGEEFDIKLNGESIGKAGLVDIKVKMFCVIPDELLMLDTGLLSIMDIEKLFHKFGLNSFKDKMIILLFKKKVKNLTETL